jgi:hypothetical protein
MELRLSRGLCGPCGPITDLPPVGALCRSAGDDLADLVPARGESDLAARATGVEQRVGISLTAVFHEERRHVRGSLRTWTRTGNSPSKAVGGRRGRSGSTEGSTLGHGPVRFRRNGT